MIFEFEMTDLDSDDEEEPAIEPNRGQKYSAQGKNDHTVCWSMPNEQE